MQKCTVLYIMLERLVVLYYLHHTYIGRQRPVNAQLFLNNRLLHGQIDFDILTLILTVKILSRLMLFLLGKVFTLHVTTLLLKVEVSWN